MPVVTFRTKVQDLYNFNDEVVHRYVRIPATLTWKHLGKREQWDVLPAGRMLRNSVMFAGTVARWVRRACEIPAFGSPNIYLVRDGKPVELPPTVTVDESSFLATVRIEITEEHTKRR